VSSAVVVGALVAVTKAMYRSCLDIEQLQLIRINPVSL